MAAFDFPNSPSVNDVHTENGVSFKWDGTVWKRQSGTGAQGPTGATGSQGATGPTGAQGQKGAQAYISDAAPSSGVTAGDLWWDSDSGDFSIYFDDGSGSPSAQWVEVGSTGPTGPTGAQGATGSGGSTGAQGAAGAQGATGGTGAQGAVGATGAQGAAGAQGSAGAQGALATINNNANNRIITGSGTPNTLNANSLLTFTSGTGLLALTGDINVTGEVQIAENIVHIGDGNTTIGFPANDTINFKTGGSERLRITSDGNVKVASGVIENSNTISSNYTVSSNYNAMSAGPMSIANGVSVTVPSGSSWTIV